jgi:hypothetical protein
MSPPNASPPVEGEAIDFDTGNDVVGTAAILWGLLCAGVTLAVLVFTLASPRRQLPMAPVDWPWVLLVCLAGWAGAGSYAWDGWCLLTASRRLVLGADRMQWVERGRVVWAVPYDAVAGVILFPGNRGERWVGIRLVARECLEQFQPPMPACWRRLGAHFKKRAEVDHAFPCRHCVEPPDRILETILTCLHRFQGESEERQ